MARFKEFCQMPEPYSPEKLPKDFAVERKIRGIRCIFQRDCFITWGDKRLPVMQSIVQAAVAVKNSFGPATLLDGVFVYQDKRPDPDHPKNAERAFGIFHIFDAVRGADMQSREKGYSYVRRKHELKDAMLKCDPRPGLMLLDAEPVSYKLNGHEAVLAIAEKIWAEGGEGVIIKDEATFYHHGLSSAWLRLTQAEIAESRKVSAT